MKLNLNNLMKKIQNENKILNYLIKLDKAKFSKIAKNTGLTNQTLSKRLKNLIKNKRVFKQGIYYSLSDYYVFKIFFIYCL